jgi:hypothetical protein
MQVKENKEKLVQEAIGCKDFPGGPEQVFTHRVRVGQKPEIRCYKRRVGGIEIEDLFHVPARNI